MNYYWSWLIVCMSSLFLRVNPRVYILNHSLIFYMQCTSTKNSNYDRIIPYKKKKKPNLKQQCIQIVGGYNG